jgi:hypothetical protein
MLIHMPIEVSPTQYIDKLVLVWPVIGFGWSQIDPVDPLDQPVTAIDPPAPFHARLVEFHIFGGRITGATGTVEEPQHPLDKQWVAFFIRDRGVDVYNLTTNPGKYNVGVGKQRPTIEIDLEVPMPQWMRFVGSPMVGGFGCIAETESWIKGKHTWIK